LPVGSSSTIFDRFTEGEVLEFTLQADLSELIENRNTEEYISAEFSFENAEGGQYTQKVKVKPRGKFRRRVCNFPPLMLNFSKGKLKEQGYIPEYDKLKLVTHCIDDKAASKEQVMKEYLAYKLYSELTDQSYRVQLAKVTYVDNKGQLGKIRRYGFLIEDTDEMAHRLGGQEYEDCHGLTGDAVSRSAENQMAVFQYMIGNTDWDLRMMRNVKLVKPYDGGVAIPVPYDFDFAGMVEAPYAIPRTEIGQLTIRQRIFKGLKADKTLFENTLRHFLSKKERLLEVVGQYKGLGRDSRQRIIEYLESFFRDAEAVLEDGQPQEPSLQQAIEGQAPETGGNTTIGK